MFIDQYSGEQIGQGVPQNRVTIQQRPKTYQNITTKGEIKETQGWEIVEELAVGPQTFKELTGQEPQSRQTPQVKKEAHPLKGFHEEIVRYRPNNKAKLKTKDHQKSHKKPIVEVIKPLNEHAQTIS